MREMRWEVLELRLRRERMSSLESFELAIQSAIFLTKRRPEGLRMISTTSALVWNVYSPARANVDQPSGLAAVSDRRRYASGSSVGR